MRKKLLVILSTILVFAMTACGENVSEETSTKAEANRVEGVEDTQTVGQDSAPLSKEEITENGYTAYDDLISSIVEEIDLGWQDDPETFGLSYIYGYNSPYFGFVKFDIDGDDIDELLIGEAYSSEDSFMIYDLYTIDVDASLIHLFCGGERDIMFIHDNVFYEEGSDSAGESFIKAYKLESGMLQEVTDADTSDLTYDVLPYDLFSNYTQSGQTE